MSYVERMAIKLGARVLPRRVALKAAKALFATQGFGWAGPTGGFVDSGEYQFVSRLLRGLDRPVVFDVGANIGEYAAMCIAVNPNATVHCFEPSAAHLERLQATLQRSIADGRVRCNPFGLSDVDETRDLYKDQEITGMASLNHRDLAHIQISADTIEHVALKCGDEYIRENGISSIDLVKIDVEGWEMSVLRGMAGAFTSKIVRACQFEFGHAHIERRENFRDFYRFLTQLGYRIGALKPNGKVDFMRVYDEIAEHYFATNYLAVA